MAKSKKGKVQKVVTIVKSRGEPDLVSVKRESQPAQPVVKVPPRRAKLPRAKMPRIARP